MWVYRVAPDGTFVDDQLQRDFLGREEAAELMLTEFGHEPHQGRRGALSQTAGDHRSEQLPRQPVVFRLRDDSPPLIPLPLPLQQQRAGLNEADHLFERPTHFQGFLRKPCRQSCSIGNHHLDRFQEPLQRMATRAQIHLRLSRFCPLQLAPTGQQNPLSLRGALIGLQNEAAVGVFLEEFGCRGRFDMRNRALLFDTFRT